MITTYEDVQLNEKVAAIVGIRWPKLGCYPLSDMHHAHESAKNFMAMQAKEGESYSISVDYRPDGVPDSHFAVLSIIDIRGIINQNRGSGDSMEEAICRAIVAFDEMMNVNP